MRSSDGSLKLVPRSARFSETDTYQGASLLVFVTEKRKYSSVLAIHWLISSCRHGSGEMIWLIASSAKFSISRTLGSRMRWCTEMRNDSLVSYFWHLYFACSATPGRVQPFLCRWPLPSPHTASTEGWSKPLCSPTCVWPAHLVWQSVLLLQG